MKKPGKLYGIGVGPGDPDLITVKAVKVLEEVDVICAPKTGEEKESIALSIARGVVKKDHKIIKAVFPMTKDEKEIQRHVERAVKMISSELEDGRDVAFITLGDPLFYSTYAYVLEGIREQVADVEIETIPGVTSISGCLAGLNHPLVGRGDRVAILPAAYGLDGLETLARTVDVIVLLKVSRSFDKIAARLEELGLKEDAIFVSGCASKGFFSSSVDAMVGKKVSYLSMIIVKGRMR